MTALDSAVALMQSLTCLSAYLCQPRGWNCRALGPKRCAEIQSKGRASVVRRCSSKQLQCGDPGTSVASRTIQFVYGTTHAGRRARKSGQASSPSRLSIFRIRFNRCGENQVSRSDRPLPLPDIGRTYSARYAVPRRPTQTSLPHFSVSPQLKVRAPEPEPAFVAIRV